MLEDNRLDSRLQTRRRSDCSFEAGGQAAKLGRHADCLPRELLYAVNARLIVDSGLDDSIGVFWYLDKNRKAVEKRLREVLRVIRFKATKLVDVSTIESEKLRNRLQTAGSLINMSRTRSHRATRANAYFPSFTKAVKSREELSNQDLEVKEEEKM